MKQDFSSFAKYSGSSSKTLLIGKSGSSHGILSQIQFYDYRLI
jgi:hypothetical protein